VGQNKLRATVSTQLKVTIDETIQFAWNPDKVILFDQASGNSLQNIA